MPNLEHLRPPQTASDANRKTHAAGEQLIGIFKDPQTRLRADRARRLGANAGKPAKLK